MEQPFDWWPLEYSHGGCRGFTLLVRRLPAHRPKPLDNVGQRADHLSQVLHITRFGVGCGWDATLGVIVDLCDCCFEMRNGDMQSVQVGFRRVGNESQHAAMPISERDDRVLGQAASMMLSEAQCRAPNGAMVMPRDEGQPAHNTYGTSKGRTHDSANAPCASRLT
jgi:hypothetical protein